LLVKTNKKITSRKKQLHNKDENKKEKN